MVAPHFLRHPVLVAGCKAWSSAASTSQPSPPNALTRHRLAEAPSGTKQRLRFRTLRSRTSSSPASAVTEPSTESAVTGTSETPSTEPASLLPAPVSVRVWYVKDPREALFMECDAEVVDFIFWVMKQPLASLVQVLRNSNIYPSQRFRTNPKSLIYRNVGSMMDGLREVEPQCLRDEDFQFGMKSNMIVRFPTAYSHSAGYSPGATYSRKGELKEEKPTYSYSPEDSIVKTGVKYIISHELKIVPVKGSELSFYEGIQFLHKLGVKNLHDVQSCQKTFHQVAAWKMIDGIFNQENPLSAAFL